jgi:hypothetical protein
MTRSLCSAGIALLLLARPAGGQAAAAKPLAGTGAPLPGQQLPPDLGFEARGSVDGLAGWTARGQGYEVVLDSISPLAGKFSLRSRYVAADPYVVTVFGVAATRYPTTLARGRAIRLTGFVRTQDVTTGYAGFWMRVDGLGLQRSTDSASEHQARPGEAGRALVGTDSAR